MSFILRGDRAYSECKACNAFVHEECRIESLEGYTALGPGGVAHSNPARGKFTCLKCCWSHKRDSDEKKFRMEEKARREEDAKNRNEREKRDLLDRANAAQQKLENEKRFKKEKWDREEVRRSESRANELVIALDQLYRHS